MRVRIFKILLVVAVITSSFSFYSLYSKEELTKYTYHDKNIQPLATGFNTLFAGSGECELCHGATGQGPNPSALSDNNGNDVSPVTDWRATMMANSAKDPLWRAKVSHEGLVNPAHKDELETTCTACHAPSGNKDTIHNGALHYLISDLENDTIGLDGVNCTACHSMSPNNLGSVFSAQMEYDTNHIIYGPYLNPVQGPMINNIGFTPEQGQHINNSALCGACHTLITNSVDTSGNLTGTTFVEQAIYHEWLNSDFNTETFPTTGEDCQTCHMPRINDNVVIANRPPWLSARSPFGLHYLVGGNAFMLNILKDNNSLLGLSATQTQFDTVINRTVKQLQQQTLNLSLFDNGRQNDTAYFDLYLENLAGHKFPAGYPSRRAYIEFLVTDVNNDTLFYSGRHDSIYRLLDEDAAYEPHYDVITNDNQVQIYEMVMGDINGNVTTVLERAYQHLKDNRIPPKGFSTQHNAYDTVKIVGNALTDSDFNYINGVEGSGGDSVSYHIPLNGYAGQLNVTATVYYQPVPPRYLDDMFQYSSQEIDLFKNLYQGADHVPVIVAQQNLTVYPVGISVKNTNSKINVYPTITNDFIYIQNENDFSLDVDIYDLKGKLCASNKVSSKCKTKLNLSNMSKGVYLIKSKVEGDAFVKRIVVQ